MGWLLELLVEGIREMVSQFIVDMMELVTDMFTDLLSCDLSLFEELFSVVGDLYKNVMVPLGIAILLLICVWQLFKSMFGKAGVSSEEPIELVLRSGICLFFIVAARTMIDYILNIAGTPYQWVVGTEIEVGSFSEYVSALEGITGGLGIDSLSISILMLIMQFVVAWNYFKMLFIIAERYVLLGVFSYTSPLAFGTGGSKATNNILSSWAKMFGGQVVLIILNAWCLKMFLSGYGNLLASGYGFTKFFVATLCLVGFCKVTFKMDSYMASLGINLGRPTNGIGALGLMMAAGRIFSHIGRGTGAAESAGANANDGTAFENGSQNASSMAGATNMGDAAGPIPMTDDFSNMSEKEAETGFGNMDADEMRQDMDNQNGFDGMESDADGNILQELGVMPEDDFGTAGMQEMENVSGDGIVSDIPGDVGQEVNGEVLGNEGNVLNEMGQDYPVEEDFDTDSHADSPMDLENGTIDGAMADGESIESQGTSFGEGSVFGSADSSFGEGEISGTSETVSTRSGSDIVSELSGGVGTENGEHGVIGEGMPNAYEGQENMDLQRGYSNTSKVDETAKNPGGPKLSFKNDSGLVGSMHEESGNSGPERQRIQGIPKNRDELQKAQKKNSPYGHE